VPALRRAILDTPPAIMLAIDYLWTRADIDTTRIEAVGASFGTPFAVTVGALDPRIARVWSVHGAARPYEQIEYNLRRQLPVVAVRTPVAALATLFASGWALDPERWVGRISPREFVMINAHDDERMPREAVDALYRAALPPRERIWLDGPHVQSNRRDVLAGLVSTVLARAATPPARLTR
jgi:dienelactone hydrolase